MPLGLRFFNRVSLIGGLRLDRIAFEAPKFERRPNLMLQLFGRLVSPDDKFVGAEGLFACD